jgi:hypothetical protein
MPNLVAYTVLFGWLLVAFQLFRANRPAVAATVVFLGALVLLPANLAVDPPGLPPIDRHVIAGFASFAGYFLAAPARLRTRGRFGWPAILIGVQLLCSFVTANQNSDLLRYGDRILPGLSIYDAFGVVFNRLFLIGVPFYLGSRILRTQADLVSALRAIVWFGIFCVPLVLWELRMGPSLHQTIYGYYPSDLAGSIRGRSYRPIGLTASGLELAMFMATAVIACAGLVRARAKVLGVPAAAPLLLLLVGLAGCKAMGAVVLGLFVSAMILWTGRRLQVAAMVVLSAVVMLYPLLRSEDLFPTRACVSAAEQVSQERADSLAFRFENEDLLLAKARERLAFGWGTYGRNRVFDDATGRDISTTDGYWIIEIGSFGLTGFLSFFALLVGPAILAARKLRFVPDPLRVTVVALAWIVLVRTIDLVPNGFFAPLSMFLAGGLMPFTRVRARFRAARSALASRRGPVPTRPAPVPSADPSARS